MDMDKAPLNRAHQLERKAETLSRQKKMDECIQCHIEAVEMYKKCLQIGDNKNVLDSIRLQKDWNERQIRMLQLKKSYLERTEKEKRLNAIASSKHSQKDVVENLEAKIFKNFETHDSLICYLAERGIIKTSDKQYQDTIEEVEEKGEIPFILGNKLPKDDSIVIEELKELSGQLRESVQGFLIRLDDRKKQNQHFIERIKNLELDKVIQEGLLIQLDDRNKEIDQLKTQIRDLELEKSSRDGSSKDNKITVSETSEATSPSSVSSGTDMDLDCTELTSLPQLDPLSIPKIDLSAFKQFRIPEVTSKLLKKEK